MVASEVLGIEEARALYANGDAAHDFDHVLRVARMAVRIAEAEGADMTAVWLAGLLHDAPVAHGDGCSPGRREHHLASAALARDLLTERGAGTELTEKVVHCIEAHRFRDRTIEPLTLEAQCVYDADKLDSMGAIGIGRVFAYAGAHDSRLWTTPVKEMRDAAELGRRDEEYTPVHEFAYKLDKLLARLYTGTARRIGEKRHAFMTAFFAQLDAEMAGEA